MNIYIASSWKNKVSLLKLAAFLRSMDKTFNVDLFCDSSTGRFSYAPDHHDYTIPQFLSNPKSREVFEVNRDMIDWSDIVILVLPSGRSAHLEAGYAIGKGKPVILLYWPVKGEFDAMYHWTTAQISMRFTGWKSELMTWIYKIRRSG